MFIDLVSRYQELVNQIAVLVKKRESFENILDLTVKTGYALLAMVKGRAFHLYLSTIASELSSLLLKDSHIEPDRRNAQERKNEERDNEEHDNEGRDANAGTDLWEPVEADATTALWKPSKAWIMLIVVQLEAANALCDFITHRSSARPKLMPSLCMHRSYLTRQSPWRSSFNNSTFPRGRLLTRKPTQNFSISSKRLKSKSTSWKHSRRIGIQSGRRSSYKKFSRSQETAPRGQRSGGRPGERGDFYPLC